MIFLCLWTIFNILPPGYLTFTHRFHYRMEQRLDAEAIRDWLSSLDESAFDGELYDLLFSVNRKTLPFSLPYEVTVLDKKIHYVRFYKKDGERYLRITWGGPYGHWGVVIGPEDMDIPATVKPHLSEDSGVLQYGEYRVKLEDGVYVWHEIQ